MGGWRDRGSTWSSGGTLRMLTRIWPFWRTAWFSDQVPMGNSMTGAVGIGCCAEGRCLREGE